MSRHPLAKRLLVAVVLVGAVLPASQAQPAAGVPQQKQTHALAISAVKAIPLLTANVDLVDLEDEVMCVVCERPLKTSGGEAADDQRAVMQGLIDQGLTKDEIIDKLVDEYGERVLVKDDSPFAGAAPVIAAVVGAGSIGLLLRRRSQGQRDGDAATAVAAGGPDPTSEPAATPATARADEPPALSADDEARIDAELAERE